MANSKKKGSRFELKVSKWFTKWTSFKFGRTPYSGANHQSRDLSSDIMCQDERHAHRCNKGCDILKFWEQASKDAKRANKVPILCMRYNSMPSEEFFFVVGKKFAPVFYKLLLGNCSIMVIDIPKIDEILYVFMASDILKNISYKLVHKQAKLILKNS